MAGSGLSALVGGLLRCKTSLHEKTIRLAHQTLRWAIPKPYPAFSKPANKDLAATLRETITKIKALPRQPDFIVHTGDITYLATPEQFDIAAEIMGEIGIDASSMGLRCAAR